MPEGGPGEPVHEEIERAIRLLAAPGGVVEIRAIADDGTHSGYFTDPHLAACSAELLALPNVHGIYVTLNEVNPALLARRQNRVKMRLTRHDATTADSDIVRRRWFPVDIDPVRPSGVSSTDGEHERAIEKAEMVAEWLTDHGFPEPVRADSGNGAHLLYRIDLEQNEESRNLVQQCLAVLSTLFSDADCTLDPAVFNASRIWKLYGTVSRKGDGTPERPHRRSRVLSVPETLTVVSRETLVALSKILPEEIPPPPPPRGRAAAHERESSPHKPMKVYPDASAPLDLRTWLREHGIRIRSEKPWKDGRIYTLEECPFSTAHTDGAFAIQFGNGAIHAGCHHAGCGGGKQRWQELRAMHEKEYAKREPSREREIPSGSIKRGRNPAPESNKESPGTAEEGDAAKEKAHQILATGDPARFILDTFSRCHVGDEIVAECYLASALSSSVKNSRGLHVCPTGDSGKGKSSSAHAFLRLLPDDARMQGSITSKALFYHTLAPGTVIIFDDFSMNEDLREVLKNATSEFQQPFCHFTLNANRQPVTLFLPPRCVWWILSVDNPGDDQVLNRMMNPWIDDSEQQDRRVRDHIFENARISSGTVPDHEDAAVCRAIFALIREHLFSVRIPFAHRIRMDNIRNRRNPIMLLDIIRSFAALRFLQREQRILPDGSIEIDAIEEDFTDAARLFSALDTTSGGQTSKLLKNEKLLIDSVLAMEATEFTLKEAQTWMGLSHIVIRRILHGRPDREWEAGGLLSKCPALSIVDTTETEAATGTTLRRRQNHYLFDYEQYRRWSRTNGVWLAQDDTILGNDAENDPDDPTGSGRDLIGITSGIRSNCMENSQNPNLNDSIQNNSSTILCRSQKEENAVASSYSPFESMEFDSQTVPAYASGNLGSIEENSSKHCENKKISDFDENHQIPEMIPNQSRLGSMDQDHHGESGSSRGKIPLPGLLDHRDFLRAKAILGKCDLCSGKEAIYQNTVTQTNCCAECYGRLVREWNIAQGVG